MGARGAKRSREGAAVAARRTSGPAIWSPSRGSKMRIVAGDTEATKRMLATRPRPSQTSIVGFLWPSLALEGKVSGPITHKMKSHKKVVLV